MSVKIEKEDLDQLISLVEERQTAELLALRQQFHLTYDSLKPLSIIKSTIAEVVSSPDIKENLLDNVIGFASGMVSKKLFIGGSHNPIKKVLGILLQLAVSNMVAKNPVTIKNGTKSFFKQLFTKKSDSNDAMTVNTTLNGAG
ncbi:MAG: hypothetical protein IPJ86_14695 [Bacteroidetes bacterium]|jgi:hypothetical protein|nr:hypothetical protein [Bacteroidota bacterium]MBK9317461.1 hypothetical protein [Bacteroidota bacterium]